MPIYTRVGDRGMTSLLGGKKLLKSDLLVDLYGSIDELNSHIGVLCSFFTNSASQSVASFLHDIQSDLYDIGSILAGRKAQVKNLQKRVKEMEERIDAMERELPELHNFILPGGSLLGSLTHVARSFCRSVERKAVFRYTSPSVERTAEKKHMQAIIQYLNRLSDFLFMLARFINNEEHIKEIEWKGLQKRLK